MTAACNCLTGWAGEHESYCPMRTPPPPAPTRRGGAVLLKPPPASAPPSRWVDLTPWLTGTYEPPRPDRGAIREGGRYLLYPGRWHTCIGPTESGKSWLAVAHIRDEILNAGRMVAYLHFEEDDPGGTLDRLRAVGVPPEVTADRFRWADNGRMWGAGDLAAELAALPEAPGLVVLDGINAACTRHGEDPQTPRAVGWYRDRFVTPATRAGAAVLSLGHPPKARDRQDERHGYGSTAWLDEVDGVGFRLTPGRQPIRRGKSGAASLHVVKDRYGQVAQLGRPEVRDGWIYAGSLVVDDAGERTSIRISAPPVEEFETAGGIQPDEIDHLADAIVAALGKREGSYGSQRQLEEMLQADKVKFGKANVGPALLRLEESERLERGEGSRGSRPGRLRPPREGSEVQDP